MSWRTVVISSRCKLNTKMGYMVIRGEEVKRIFLDELVFALPGDICCDKCSVAGLLKGMGIRLEDRYEAPLERLLDLMELVREFDQDKLFVIVGLRSCFGNEKVGSFFKTVLDHGYRVLLLDCVAKENLPREKRLTIDNDLCEF